MTHISRISFCGLRRLNSFESNAADAFPDWMNRRKWYDFKSINVFIGVNGGGKSTILELIDSLREPGRLVSLPRENQKGNRLNAFEIEFDDSKRLLAISTSHAVNDAPNASNLNTKQGGLIDVQSLQLIGLAGDHKIFSFQKNISKIELDAESRQELKAGFDAFRCEVAYWNLDTQVDPQNLVDALNKASTHLIGVLSSNFEPKSEYDMGVGALDYKKTNPFHFHDNNRVGIWLSDDVGQQNFIHLNALPAGWRQLASILCWLVCRPEGSVCLIEEPEAHLHPRLQRYLAHEMERIAIDRSLQLFISTHSTVFQQSNIWQDTPGIFEATAEHIVEFTSAWRVLDALGIKGSDISQSNGIIWIEGPSDRRYIKHWIQIYCKENGVQEPKENVDYSFAFYGGSLLSHLSILDTDSFIDMLGINRNMIIVIDRDKDFGEDEEGKLICLNTKSAKARVLEELKKIDPVQCHAWITDGYTIESYLPETYRKKYFAVCDDRLVLKSGRKVEIAAEYINTFHRMEDCSDMPGKLTNHVNAVCNAIRQWGK